MKALLLSKSGALTENFYLSDSVKKPSPGAHELLVKVVAIAINPVDWKMAKLGFLIKGYPVVLGCDFSGVVEEVGGSVTKFKNGDEVFGFTDLGAPGCGTFAEYCLASETFTVKKPSNMSFESASTIPVGCFTAALGIFYKMKIPFPSQKSSDLKDEFFLVWGGSGSVGAYAVQLAALAGLTVIATCSPRNYEYVKSLGATHVVDHNSPDAVSQIKSITSGKLRFAYDTISTATANLCLQCLSTSSPSYISYIAGKPSDPIPQNVTENSIFLGGAYQNELDKKFIESFVTESAPLLESKKLHPNQVEQLPNGLESIKVGIELQASGKISGKKPVVRIH